MVNGEYGNDGVVRLEVNCCCSGCNYREDVLLAEHNSLAGAGCSGCEEKLCKCVSVLDSGIDVSCLKCALSLCEKRLERECACIAKLFLGGIYCDKVLQCLVCCLGIIKLFIETCGVYDNVSVNTLEERLDLLDVELLVHGNYNVTVSKGCEVCSYPSNGCLADDSNSGILKTERIKSCRDLFDERRELGVGNVVELS